MILLKRMHLNQVIMKNIVIPMMKIQNKREVRSEKTVIAERNLECKIMRMYDQGGGAIAHTINQCTSEKRCRSCSKPHHSLLHFPADAPFSFSENVSNENPRASNSNASERSEVASEFSDTASHSHINKTTTVGMLMNDREILLPTVLINIKDKFEQWHTIRVILDTGAQSSFISRRFSMKPGLPEFNIAMTLQGLDKMCTFSKSGVHCTIAPLHNTNYTVDFNAIVPDKICDEIPATSFSIKKFSFLSKLKLLLGNDIFPYVLQDGRLYNGPYQPVCINTIFG
ncbi:hypothetical protein JTB14_025170 [Gonioctena quinquepunctata]|nr:hypothetical protein JTB14_025170 [Gonioctena quinquepunctata]